MALPALVISRKRSIWSACSWETWKMLTWTLKSSCRTLRIKHLSKPRARATHRGKKTFLLPLYRTGRATSVVSKRTNLWKLSRRVKTWPKLSSKTRHCMKHMLASSLEWAIWELMILIYLLSVKQLQPHKAKEEHGIAAQQNLHQDVPSTKIYLKDIRKQVQIG